MCGIRLGSKARSPPGNEQPLVRSCLFSPVPGLDTTSPCSSASSSCSSPQSVSIALRFALHTKQDAGLFPRPPIRNKSRTRANSPAVCPGMRNERQQSSCLRNWRQEWTSNQQHPGWGQTDAAVTLGRVLDPWFCLTLCFSFLRSVCLLRHLHLAVHCPSSPRRRLLVLISGR